MKEDQIMFGLRKITTGQFATIDLVDIKENSIHLNFGFNFGINAEHRLVGCNVKLEFLSNEQLFIVIEVLCDFEVAPESWENFANDGSKITLPLSMITHMAVLTVGTARGVLHSRTENTKYNKYFLPTINVTDSITSDITINLQGVR